MRIHDRDGLTAVMYRLLRLALLVAAGWMCLKFVGVDTRFEAVHHSISGAEASGSRSVVLREEPIRIQSIGNMKDQIPTDALVDLLRFMEPYWEYRRASDILHALRLWGPDAKFPEKAAYRTPLGIRPMSGAEMLQFFTDGESYRERYPNARSYFFRSPFGLGARQGSKNPALTGHWDDFVALAAEIGLRAKHPIYLRHDEGDGKVADVLHHSMAWFDPSNEVEFSAVAYAQYLDSPATWKNRFGHEFSLDTLVDCLAGRNLELAPCHGSHVPYSLAVILRVDALSQVLSDAARQKARTTLRELSNDLTRLQHAGGFWSRHWCRKLAQAPAVDDEHVEWVRVTGHHLEWMALVPADLRPQDEVIKKAIQFLLKSLRNRNSGVLPQGTDYAPCSHAARALVLWSGHYYAAEVMQEDWQRRNIDGMGRN